MSDKDKKYSIYKITYIIDGKFYIGKTEEYNPINRWKKHLSQLKNPKKCHYLYNAIIAHGVENFTFEIIAECKNSIDLKQLEIDIIAYYNTTDRSVGFNLTKGGDGCAGYKHTKETKEKLSIINKNRNISGSNNPMFGKHHTDETKLKMSKKQTEIFKYQKSSFYGKKHTEQSKIKNSQTKKSQLKIVVTLSQISEIRKLYNNGWKQQDIAEKFKISLRTVHSIIHKKMAYTNL